MGYTAIGSTRNGIEAETRYFVPLGENLEVWQLTVTNKRAHPAKISAFSSIEFCLWDAQDDATNFQRNFNTGQVEVEDGVIYHKTEYRERRDHFAYFACSEPLAGFEPSARHFWAVIAAGIHRPPLTPASSPTPSPTAGRRSERIRSTLNWLPARPSRSSSSSATTKIPSTEKFDPPASQTINKKLVKPTISKYLDTKNADAAFEQLRQYWESLLGIFQVNTPDPHTNRMVNIWNAYQCMATFNMCRSASFYESGIGRGLGFRDSNQDLLGFVHMAPARARERILDLAATQLPTGGAYHQYQPLTKRGNNDIGGGFNDDPHWLIIGVSAYLKETGDWSILDEPVQYDNEPGSEQPLYEHLQRSFNYTLSRLGPHGLPLIGRADWNDCLNLNCFSDTPGQSFQTTTNKDGKVAESVFIAGLFVHSGRELAAIANRRGLAAEAEATSAESAKMESVIWSTAGTANGSCAPTTTSAARSARRNAKRARSSSSRMDTACWPGSASTTARQPALWPQSSEHLATKHGIVVQQPAYTHYYLRWAKSPRIRRATRRMRASSATSTRG